MEGQMLTRYSSDAKGKAVQKALIYTKKEHGIQKDLLDPEAVRIILHLRNYGYEGYIVGGAVRDMLIGKTPKDFDIVTNAEPARIKRIFRNSRIIGKRFRLVHIFFGEKIFEVSTFRSLVEGTTGNSFGTMDEDVQRRDFTLNALYYDPIKEQVIDYVGGVKDVRAHRLVPVIPLKIIFKDDPVRMLRAVKYSVSTGCKIPFMLGRAIRKSSSLLEPVSPSRLTEEIIKILNSGHARPIVHEALRYDLYMYLQPAAASLIDGNPAFAKDYEESLGKLDELIASGEETRLGRKLVFFIESLIKVIVKEKIPPSEVYNRVYSECRRFVMPMNPPRVELEFAVRFGLKELGFNVRLPRARERFPGNPDRDRKRDETAEFPGEARDSDKPEGTRAPRRRRRRRSSSNATSASN
jgi:poly(A) polymerase